MSKTTIRKEIQKDITAKQKPRFKNWCGKRCEEVVRVYLFAEIMVVLSGAYILIQSGQSTSVKITGFILLAVAAVRILVGFIITHKV